MWPLSSGGGGEGLSSRATIKRTYFFAALLREKKIGSEFSYLTVFKFSLLDLNFDNERITHFFLLFICWSCNSIWWDLLCYVMSFSLDIYFNLSYDGGGGLMCPPKVFLFFY